ncbi:MAG: BPL-N domain-containing protein [Candidatus Limimorpha sp.]
MKTMRPFSIMLTISVLSLGLWSCNEAAKTAPEPIAEQSVEPIIKVGVFSGHGGAETCKWETLEAIKVDHQMRPYFIGSSDIASGCLDTLDAIVIPGGGGSRQYLNLGHENRLKIMDFIRNGGGAVGICAGAYLFSNTDGYACMKLNGAKAIDIEHDNRGHGVAKFTLDEAGKALFPELANRDTCFVMYYEGPVFVEAGDTIAYQVFATMQSDVHEEGNAPENMTNAKPFFIGNEYGQGRIFSSIAHPEATPGMHWLIPRMVRWTLRKEGTPYSANAVRPDLYNREILFTKEMLQQESDCYPVFLYGGPEEKIAAIDWLETHLSWDAKRWLQGLLFDASPEVRARAAQYVANVEFSYYLPDLEAACRNEQDPATKAVMENAIAFLKGI